VEGGFQPIFPASLVIIIELIATTDIDAIARRGVADRPRTAPKRDREKKKGQMIEISGGVVQIGFPRRGITRSGDVDRGREGRRKRDEEGSAGVAAITATCWIA